MLFPRIFVTLSLLFSGAVNASAGAWLFRSGAAANQPTISSPSESEQNITLTRSMANVQEILESIQTSPSCKRQAAKGLVDSCIKYDHKDPANTRSTHVELEQFQKVYGIRMSHCELDDAAQTLPSECNVVLYASPADLKGTSHIKVCLDALFQEVNPWTTYQSAKTDGLIMCQAMRVENDKDEQLHFFQVLMSTTSDISEAMSYSRDELKELQDGFSGLKDGMRGFRMELHNDNREIKAAVKESFTSIQKDMSGVSGDLHGLLRSMGEANQNLHAYTSQVDDALANAKSLSMQMDSRWATGLTKIQDDLQDARGAYQYQLELYATEFHQRVYAITSSMETANDLSKDLLSKLTLLNEDLDLPLEKVTEIAIQADHVKDTQSAMVTQLQDQVDSIHVNLVAAGEHAAFFSAWMGTAAGFTRNFFDKIWRPISAFFIWYGLAFCFVFVFFRRVIGLFNGSMVTFASALVLTISFDPRDISTALVDSHPAFFQETPPYLSMLAMFAIGVATTPLIQILRQSQQSPAYDPATQLKSLPQFQDDLDIHEQKLKQEYYQAPY